MKNFINKHAYALAAFIIPVFVMYLVYVTFYIYPIGNGSVLVLDLNGQYVSYFEYFRDCFYEGKSLFYAWNTSLGGEFLGTAAYYLLSPFSFIVLLFPKAHLVDALLVITLCKLGCASLMMFKYLRAHNHLPIHALLMALGYGLGSYAVVQAMNLMWIDALIMLPIFILGVERLVNKQDNNLMTFALIYLIITNYYIAYMLGLFGGLYFIYYCFDQELTLKEGLERFGRFLLQALFACMIAMPIVLPVIYSLSLGKSTFTTPSYDIYVKFDLLDFFVKLLPATYDSVNVQGLPFVYGGLLAVLLVPLYFLNQQISLKKKYLNVILLAIVICCMNVSIIDLALHGFQNPNWLNYRYAFVVPFLMIRMGCEGLKEISKLNPATLFLTIMGLIISIVVIQKFNFYYVDDFFTILLSIGLLIIYGCLLLASQKGWNSLIVIVLLIALFGEYFANGYCLLHDLDEEVAYSSRDSYNPFMEGVRNAVSYIENNEDVLLYRVEKNFHRTVNDPLSANYNGISHSTSSLNKDAIKVIGSFGYAADAHWTKYLGGTPISDSILGIKYVMSHDFLPYYHYQDSVNDVLIYKNQYALSLINSVSSNILNVHQSYSNALEFQNAYFSAMLGMPYTEFFEPIEVELELENAYEYNVASHTCYRQIDSSMNSEIFFRFNNSNGKRIFFYFPSSYPREVNMWFNEEFVDTYFGNETKRVFDLGEVKDGDKLGLTLINDEVYLQSDANYFYAFNDELFETCIRRFIYSKAEFSEVSNTKLVFKLTSKEDEIALTSMPYQLGWKIYVDGVKVDYYKVNDAFIGFNVSEGEHEIVMKFTPQGFDIGLILAFIGLIGWFVTDYLLDYDFKVKIHNLLRKKKVAN